MAQAINEIRTQTARVKKHILGRFLNYAEIVDKGEELPTPDMAVYKELLLIFAKSVVPRSTEITGEDGQAINISFDNAFKATQGASQDSGEQVSV